MAKRGFVAGASAALNKTISEIMEFREDDGRRPGGRSAKLRPFLHKKLGDLIMDWYKRGFRRGVMECRKVGEVPAIVAFTGRREFFTEQEREFEVTSRRKPPPRIGERRS